MKRLGMVFAWLVVLMGCASDRQAQSCAALSAEVQYCLQPNHVMPDFSVLQQVDVDWNQRHELTLTRLEKDQQGFVMAVVSPLGQSLMQVQYSGQGVRSVGGLAQVDPVWVLSLLQLVYWPKDSVESGLRGNFEWFAVGRSRRLLSSGVVLMDADFEGERFSKGGGVTIHLPRQHLRIQVKNLQEGEDL